MIPAPSQGDARRPSAEIVVCTRNRAGSLRATCEAILRQDYPADLWRLLIVDNASTDDTWAWSSGLAERHPHRVRAMRNEELGHSASRNFAVRATSSDIVAFTDDDALPDESWLRTLIEVMEQERAWAVGGPVDLVLSGDLHSWFIEPYLMYLAIWRPTDRVVSLLYNELPRGVNLAIKREAFERCGLFNPELGLRGKRQLFCDETEFGLRIERHGGRIVYSPQSRVRHCVEARRFTQDWMLRRFAAQGRSEAIVNWIHGGLRGLRIGLRPHLHALRPAGELPVSALAGGTGGLTRQVGALTPAEREEAQALWVECRRRALFGYLRQMPVAMARVPRYRPRDGGIARWPAGRLALGQPLGS